MKIPIKERRKYVIELYKKNYKNREIAKELRISSRDITKILNEDKKEEKEAIEKEVKEKEEKEKKRLFSSTRSEALKLYKKGTNLLDVAIELNISAEEAKTFYREYCSFTYPPQFVQLYTELDNNNSFKRFTDLFHLIKEKGLSIEEAHEGIGMIEDVSLLKEEHYVLSNKVTSLKNMNDSLIDDNNFLTDQIAKMDKKLSSTSEKIELCEKNCESINKIVRQKEKEIYKMHSSEDYFKAREKAKLLVEEFLGKEIHVIQQAVLSLFKVVKENSQKENPHTDFDKSVNEYVSNSSDNEVNREKLNNVAEKVWDSISEICTDDILNPSSNISKN
jgi:hypothetical protein